MQDSVTVRVPLLPRWGKSLSGPGVTQPQNSCSLPCGHYLKSPVCWPVMLSTQKATRCICILKCAPTPGVQCPSRRVLFVSFSCWVTPNRSLFTAWAPSGRLQVPSLLSILRWLLFPKHSRTKLAPLGILWAFFFPPTTTFLSIFPQMLLHSWNRSFAQATCWGLLCPGCLRALVREVLDRGPRNPVVIPSGTTSVRGSLCPPAPPHVPPGDSKVPESAPALGSARKQRIPPKANPGSWNLPAGQEIRMNGGSHPRDRLPRLSGCDAHFPLLESGRRQPVSLSGRQDWGSLAHILEHARSCF